MLKYFFAYHTIYEAFIDSFFYYVKRLFLSNPLCLKNSIKKGEGNAFGLIKRLHVLHNNSFCF